MRSVWHTFNDNLVIGWSFAKHVSNLQKVFDSETQEVSFLPRENYKYCILVMLYQRVRDLS